MSSEVILKGRLNGVQRNRLKRLLNMMYSPRELAEEISIHIDKVYQVYIPDGCPHSRDAQRHYWINGLAFKQWYENQYRKKYIESGQAFCKTCKRGVEIVNPERRTSKSGDIYLYSKCPACGRGLIRFIENHKKNDKP